MSLNTFPCTVEAIHTTGVSIVHCQAIGYRNVFLTDDFGNLLEVVSASLTAFSLVG